MKQLMLIILGLILISSSYAQDYSKVKYNLATPFTGVFTEKRFTGENIETHYYNGKGEETNSAIIEYKRSKDGLRDTVFTHSGASRIDEYVYSQDNKLVAEKGLFFDRENDDELIGFGYETKYTYDSEGRIASISLVSTDDYEKSGSIVYNYSDHTISHYSFTGKNGSELREFEQIEYTDSGYIRWDTTYYNNVIVGGRDTSYTEYRKDEYIFDSDPHENRLKRVRGIIDNGNYKREYDAHMSYTADGYTIFYGNNWKEEYFVNEKEQNTLILAYRLTGNGWELSERSELTYVYAGDPQSNTPLADEPQPVYGIENGIIVTAEVNSPIFIYTISGQLVKKVNAQPNEQIPLPKGVYVVTVNNSSYKVIVK